MRISIRTNCQAFEKELNYVVSFIDDHPLKPADLQFGLNLEATDLTLVYDHGEVAEEKKWIIPNQELLFSSRRLETDALVSNTYRCHNGQMLHSVEAGSSGTGVFFSNGIFGFDILETVFFHITRYEENFSARELNDYTNWLREDRHFLVKHRLEKEPVVDQLLTALYETLSGLVIRVPTTYSLTHDLDIIYRFRPFHKFIRSIAANLYYRRGWQQLSQEARYYCQMLLRNKPDPYDCFSWMLSSEGGWQQKTMYIMTGGNTPADNKYNWKSKALAKILKEALDKGYAIGLHPSYNAGVTIGMYALERQRLQELASDYDGLSRQHWLRFDWTTTPEILERNDVKEDASLGYNRHLGFRGGTGFPYRLFDFGNRRAFPWMERPLALMESAAIHESRNTGRPIDRVITDFLATNRYNTAISLNFHNSNFDPTLESGRLLKDLYLQHILSLRSKPH